MNDNSINDENKPLDAPYIEYLGTPANRDWDEHFQDLAIEIGKVNRDLDGMDSIMKLCEPDCQEKLRIEKFRLIGEVMDKVYESRGKLFPYMPLIRELIKPCLDALSNDQPNKNQIDIT